MSFSSIKRKKCKCGKCNRYPTMGYKGYNISCFPQEFKDAEPEKYKKSAVNNRNRASLSKISKMVHTSQNEVLGQEEAKNRKELEQWFDNIARQIARNPKCSECGTFIPSAYYRHATAHIFPKSLFPSVATHPMNYLILGAGCGCHDKTHRLDTFSDMKVFGEAVRRFKLFEKSITEKHKYLDAFKKYADGTF